MYKFHYDEVQVDEVSRQRDGEKRAIEHSIALLRKAQGTGCQSCESAEALAFLNRLWGFFIEELSREENPLPPNMRAKLMSIGLWIIRESDSIVDGRSDNFRGLIEVSETIAEGLQ